MIKYLKTSIVSVVTIAGIILLICIAPWVLFWSIESLFGFVIPFTFWNWLAVFVLLGLVRGSK